MAYLMINGTDYSNIVSGIKINYDKDYTTLKTAIGYTFVDYITTNTTLEVSVIALDDNKMKSFLNDIDDISISVSYRYPGGVLRQLTAFAPSNSIEYYTIQQNNVSFKGMTVKLVEITGEYGEEE